MLWRWHFYAAIFVVPLLVILSLTGLVYLYKAQIEAYLYAEQLYVTPQESGKKSLQELYAIAQTERPNTHFTVEVHEAADRSAQFIYADGQGGKASIFINPYTGEILADMPTLKQNATYLVGMARQIHRNLLSGSNGHIVMELAACWTLIMMFTGWGLWWARKRREGWKDGLLPKKNARGRPFWVQWHSFIGVILSIGVVFFVMTGMPWTSVWGSKFKEMVAAVNLGFPPIPAAVSGHEDHVSAANQEAKGQTINDKKHDVSTGGTHQLPALGEHANHVAVAGNQHEDHNNHVLPKKIDDLTLENKAWSAGLLPIPESEHGHQQTISLDDVTKIANANNIQEDYSIVPPKNEKGVYTVSYYPSEPTLEKVLNIDQYTGKIINQLAYKDYGAIAKVIEHGVYLHMGTYFGWLNQLICAVLTLGLVFVSISGVIMWAKRKIKGRLSSPPLPVEVPSMTKWVVGFVIFGIIFPPAGLSMLIVYGSDRLYMKLKQR
nr:PepSY domain-containing protein [Pelistega europaea]